MHNPRVFFIYEPAQVPLLDTLLREGAGYRVVALTYETELELQARRIPFISSREYATNPESDRETIELVRRLARVWCEAPGDFFSHRGIPLGLAYEGALFHYFTTLIQFLDVMRGSIERLSPSHLHIPATHHSVGLGADPTAHFKEQLPVAIARMLGAQFDIGVEVLPAPASRTAIRARQQLYWWLNQFGVRLVIGASNFINGLRSRRPLRILSTDPWSRLAPYLSQLPDAELVLTRRSEFGNMGASIWRTKARFHHPLDFARATDRAQGRALMRAWEGVRSSVQDHYRWRGISFWPVAQEVLDAVVADAPHAVAAVESIRRMLQRRDINRVLLFSSVKWYNYFFARVAEQLNIPSIEMQHALEVTEPTHPFARLYTRYLAAYGALTARHYERFGVAPWRLILCGSPRFDAYARMPVLERRKDTTALVILPAIYFGGGYSDFTSYAAQEVLKDTALMQRAMPDLRLILRPRPGTGEPLYWREEVRAMFPQERWDNERPLQELIAQSDVVISGNSTAAIEAMIMHKPVIIYLPKTEDHDFDEYAAAGAVLLARTAEELRAGAQTLMQPQERKALVARADAFLEKNVMMDGKAAERVSNLIRQPPEPHV